MGYSYSCTYPYVTSHNTSGCFAAIRRSVLAAPDGVLLPCSQSRRVRAEMPRSAANFSWDRPVFARASATSMRSAGMISSFSTVPSLRVTSRRNEPSGCGMKRVFRAHWIRPLLSMISMKRRTASLALLTVEHLLDLFEPCAGYIVALSLPLWRPIAACGKRWQLNELPQHKLIYGNAVQIVKGKVQEQLSLRHRPRDGEIDKGKNGPTGNKLIAQIFNDIGYRKIWKRYYQNNRLPHLFSTSSEIS